MVRGWPALTGVLRVVCGVGSMTSFSSNGRLADAARAGDGARAGSAMIAAGSDAFIWAMEPLVGALKCSSARVDRPLRNPRTLGRARALLAVRPTVAAG